jgi:hypothetical protein
MPEQQEPRTRSPRRYLDVNRHRFHQGPPTRPDPDPPSRQRREPALQEDLARRGKPAAGEDAKP